MLPVLTELERRRLFHGWAFEERTRQERAALRYWLRTGEEDVSSKLSAKDKALIIKHLSSLKTSLDLP